MVKGLLFVHYSMKASGEFQTSVVLCNFCGVDDAYVFSGVVLHHEYILITLTEVCMALDYIVKNIMIVYRYR